MRSFWSAFWQQLRGLQFRSTVLLMVVVTTATLLCGMLFLRLATRLAAREANAHAQDLAKTLAIAAAAPLGANDRAALLSIAENLVPGPTLSYVAFTDPTGEILAGYQRGSGQLTRWIGADGRRLHLKSYNEPVLVSRPNEDPCIDVVYPVTDRPPSQASTAPAPVVGFVRLGLNLSSVDRGLAAVWRQVSGISIGIALLMVPLGFEIVRRIVAPVNEMTTAARRMAAGDLRVKVEVERRDEIGVLAAAFNSMASDLLRSHNQLLKLNSELEDRVTRRTAQLQRANRLLQAEMTEREEFLRAVSHDLNAPLRNIAGQALLLRRRLGDAVSDGAKHALERIEHNVRYELGMIDDLLELSRIRSHQEPVRVVDVDSEVRLIARQLEFEMQKKGIRFLVAGHLPRVVCEPRRIRHLMQNLIDNAVKYTAAHAPGAAVPTITISCKSAATEHEFRVADRGIGVRSEDHNEIFKVFGRARTEFVSQTPGKGLGLAFCRSIVQLAGGRLWVEENPGGGSVFCFTLPRESGSPKRTVASSTESRPAPSKTAATRGRAPTNEEVHA